MSGHVHWISPYVTPQPSTVFEDCLSRKDFDKIFKDPELFLHTFSKDEYVKNEIRNFVYEIHKILLKNFEEKKEFTILFITNYNKIVVKEQSDAIPNFAREEYEKISNDLYLTCIKPAMQNLQQLFGISYTFIKVNQQVLDGRPYDEDEYDVEADAFKIEWHKKDGYAYSIPPIQVTPSAVDPYSLYKEGKFCDLTLVAKEGEIKVHSLPFYASGGEIIQRFLTTPLKEATRKEILFTDFSLETVKAFVDFIYLGEDGLKPETHVPLAFNLFVMACTYNIKPLIDCCANLINLGASKDNAETIKYLAETYDNDHLKALYEHLSDDGRAKRIKV